VIQRTAECAFVQRHVFLQRPDDESAHDGVEEVDEDVHVVRAEEVADEKHHCKEEKWVDQNVGHYRTGMSVKKS